MCVPLMAQDVALLAVRALLNLTAIRLLHKDLAEAGGHHMLGQHQIFTLLRVIILA